MKTSDLSKLTTREKDTLTAVYVDFMNIHQPLKTLYTEYKNPSPKKVRIWEELDEKYQGVLHLFTHNTEIFTAYVFFVDEETETDHIAYITPSKTITLTFDDFCEIAKERLDREYIVKRFYR